MAEQQSSDSNTMKYFWPQNIWMHEGRVSWLHPRLNSTKYSAANQELRHISSAFTILKREGERESMLPENGAAWSVTQRAAESEKNRGAEIRRVKRRTRVGCLSTNSINNNPSAALRWIIIALLLEDGAMENVSGCPWEWPPSRRHHFMPLKT